MKTKEFIRNVEELGFKMRTHDYIDGEKYFIVYRKDNCFTIAYACKNRKNMFDTNFVDFSELPQEKQNALFNLLVEYASTPIEKREEPKKYYIRHKHIRDDWNYLNHNLETKEWDINSIHETSMFRVRFTLSELPDWAHEMLEQGHLVKEEVE